MKDYTELVFTGDIGFDKYMDKKWEDDSLVSPSILDFLQSGDHLIVNVEGPLCAKNKDIVGGKNLDEKAASLLHSMDADATKFLDRIGADIWNICNNHICDAGAAGIESTLLLAKEHNAMTLGAGMNISQASSPIILNEAGGIGMISVGYQRACRKASEENAGCFSWSDLGLIKQKISEIKKTCKWCIIVAHAGEEFTALPSPYTRNRYLEYLNMGADIIVAHHPHVPMNYETFPDSKAIFYSLGNFVFDTDYQRSQFNTEKGIILKLKLSSDSFEFVPIGIKIDRDAEKILESDLPLIFENVCEEEYNLLSPLAAKMFIANTKRQLKYMKPDQFLNATEDDFIKNFYEPLRSGRVPGECLDFQLIYPLSLKAEAGEWKKSQLENVKQFILEQIP